MVHQTSALALAWRKGQEEGRPLLFYKLHSFIRSSKPIKTAGWEVAAGPTKQTGIISNTGSGISVCTCSAAPPYPTLPNSLFICGEGGELNIWCSFPCLCEARTQSQLCSAGYWSGYCFVGVRLIRMDGADTSEWNAELTEVKELGKIAPMLRLRVVASSCVQAND